MRDTRAIARLTAIRAPAVSRLLLALAVLGAATLAPAPALGQVVGPPVIQNMTPAVATPNLPPGRW